MSHRGRQCGVGDRHGTQPIARPEGQYFRLDQAEPFDSSRVGVMAEQREGAGFEPSAFEKEAVAAKGLRCCDQIGENEPPVGAECDRELVGQPAECHLTIQQPKDHGRALVQQDWCRPWRPSHGLA
ncbi:hypothetical protein BN381_480022 [Candidatus Microthrix parvicella RN1]|uniref:Uncharacterized protein n=1 Tax=Candidatus Neomicrothrix parvicella RN1 TaxID=1229780 RepID=R4Z2H5_9ACTN|nr:hypothetical protein BN381_480022 [Candidatus Microthrix parvicella RN1]